MLELIWTDISLVIILSVKSFIDEETTKLVIVGAIIHASSLVLWLLSLMLLRYTK